MLDGSLQGWRQGSPRVAFESGRYLVGGCGTLICAVQDVKNSKGRTYVVLDSGINHLGGMSGLGRVLRTKPEIIRLGDSESTDIGHKADIVGPLCTPLDSLARDASTPELTPGDLVAIANVGAYGLTGSLIDSLVRSHGRGDWKREIIGAGKVEERTLRSR